MLNYHSQWFGDYVTMKWWSDLWLNEGLATYFSYIGVDAVNPDIRMVSRYIHFITTLPLPSPSIQTLTLPCLHYTPSPHIYFLHSTSLHLLYSILFLLPLSPIPNSSQISYILFTQSFPIPLFHSTSTISILSLPLYSFLSSSLMFNPLQRDQFIVYDQDVALYHDSLADTHPVHIPTPTRVEISSMFNKMTYSKVNIISFILTSF